MDSVVVLEAIDLELPPSSVWHIGGWFQRVFGIFTLEKIGNDANLTNTHLFSKLVGKKYQL